MEIQIKLNQINSQSVFVLRILALKMMTMQRKKQRSQLRRAPGLELQPTIRQC